MKYCINLTLRKFFDGNSVPLISSYYYESHSLSEFNSWIFNHICNTNDNYEIINLFFEVVKE